MPALSEPADDDDWDGETGLITDVVKRHESDLAERRRLRLRAAADGRGGASPLLDALGVPEKHIYYDKFTTTGEPDEPRTARPSIDDAPRRHRRRTQRPEAGLHRRRGRRQGVPGLDQRRSYNYYTPAKRKQTHYEDVTVEVQPDPRHYLTQGWLYGFADGRGGYPLDWTALKAWGIDRPEPERFPGSGGKGYDWPAHGWHEFRDPNEEWELTLYRYNANVVRQLNQNIEHGPADQGVRAVEPELGAASSSARRRVDARRARPRPVPVRQRQPARARRTCTTTRSR